MLNAVVIPFPKRAAAEMRANLNVNGPAQVIIFPGIRYERWDEAHAVTSNSSEQRHTSRDVLELAE